MCRRPLLLFRPQEDGAEIVLVVASDGIYEFMENDEVTRIAFASASCAVRSALLPPSPLVWELTAAAVAAR